MSTPDCQRQTREPEKQFECQTCHKFFVREGLLRRHCRRQHLHRSTANKVKVACRPCAALKLGCGTERPCLHCIQKDRECVPQVKEGYINSIENKIANLKMKKAAAAATIKAVEKEIVELETDKAEYQDALRTELEKEKGLENMHPTAGGAVGYSQQEDDLYRRGPQQDNHTSDPFQHQAQEKPTWSVAAEGMPAMNFTTNPSPPWVGDFQNAVPQLQPLNDHSQNALPQQGDRPVQAVYYTNVHAQPKPLQGNAQHPQHVHRIQDYPPQDGQFLQAGNSTSYLLQFGQWCDFQSWDGDVPQTSAPLHSPPPCSMPGMQAYTCTPGEAHTDPKYISPEHTISQITVIESFECQQTQIKQLFGMHR